MSEWQNSRLADQLYQAAEAAGGKDIPRVVASIEMTCAKGTPIEDALASLRRHQPNLFAKPKRKFTDAPKPSRESASRGKGERRRPRFDDE